MQSGRRCITSLSQLARSLSSKSEVATTNPWNSVVIPLQTLKDIPTSSGGAAFAGDIRATSGLGRGDGIKDHTGKWMQGSGKSPIQYIAESEPILVEGPVVASHGADDPLLGCPVEYINLRGTSKEHPAVCKYTGNRYYSLPHTWRHH